MSRLAPLDATNLSFVLVDRLSETVQTVPRISGNLGTYDWDLAWRAAQSLVLIVEPFANYKVSTVNGQNNLVKALMSQWNLPTHI